MWWWTSDEKKMDTINTIFDCSWCGKIIEDVVQQRHVSEPSSAMVLVHTVRSVATTNPRMTTCTPHAAVSVYSTKVPSAPPAIMQN